MEDKNAVMREDFAAMVSAVEQCVKPYKIGCVVLDAIAAACAAAIVKH